MPTSRSSWTVTEAQPRTSGSRARTRSSRSTAPATTPTIRRDGDHEAAVTLRAARRRSRRTTSAWSTPWPRGRSGATRPELPARAARTTATSCSWPAPQVKPADVKPQPKTVVFVLDRSGSMAGKKIEQARNALKFVLDNLRDDDTFNIVAYDDRVETFKPELQRYSSRTRGRGRAVRREHPRGGQHQHRRRPEGGPGDDPGRLAARTTSCS